MFAKHVYVCKTCVCKTCNMYHSCNNTLGRLATKSDSSGDRAVRSQKYNMKTGHCLLAVSSALLMIQLHLASGCKLVAS